MSSRTYGFHISTPDDLQIKKKKKCILMHSTVFFFFNIVARRLLNADLGVPISLKMSPTDYSFSYAEVNGVPEKVLKAPEVFAS